MNEASQAPAQPKPKLLDRVRHEIRARHYSPRTEDPYVHWIKRFIFFHAKRHPLPPSFATHCWRTATTSELSKKSWVTRT